MNNINKDFCCDDFSKAKKILEGTNSCKYCYALGPTGPRGPTGPAPDVAYGERYLDLEQELALTADQDTLVPLNLG